MYVMLSYVFVKYVSNAIICLSQICLHYNCVHYTLNVFFPLQLGPHKDYPITSKITIKIIEETVVDLKVVFVEFIAYIDKIREFLSDIKYDILHVK